MPPRKPSKTRGRPKLEDGRAKSVLIQVRVTPEEAKAIEEEASRAKRPRSEWIRRRLAPDAAPPVTPPQDPPKS